MSNNNIDIVEKYLKALSERDLSQTPISDDIKFDNPISGKGEGKRAYSAFLTGFLSAINEIKVVRHIADGDLVATEWEVDGAFGIVSVVEIYRIENGLIAEMKAYFDPRPVFG